MKKILGLLAMIFIVGCDDGDMTFQSFDFTDAQVRNCEEGIIYKVNGSEALVLELAASSFANVATQPNTPRIVTIGTGNNVTYLKYGSDLTGNPGDIICNPLPSVSPVEVWNASGGTIEITTRAEHEDPEDDELITGYTHTIFLRSVSFTRNGETIVIQNNNFGDYETDLEYVFDFTPTTLQLKQCPEADVLYMTNRNEVLRMMLNHDELFTNDLTEKIQPINDENKVYLEIYSISNFTPAIICAEEQFQLTGKWKAVNGEVHVTTTEAAGVFSHQIKFVNMEFQNIANTAESFIVEEHILGDTYIPAP